MGFKRWVIGESGLRAGNEARICMAEDHLDADGCDEIVNALVLPPHKRSLGHLPLLECSPHDECPSLV